MSIATPTVSEVLEKHTPEQAESRYRSMIVAVASGRRHEVDPAITEASGRFECDGQQDLEVARRRVQAVAEIEAATATLAELEKNPPLPRPQRFDLVANYRTLGELGVALYAVQNFQAIWGPDADHSHARAAARAAINSACSFLRFSADKSLDRRERDCRQEIVRLQAAVAEQADLVARRDALLKTANRPGVRPEDRETSVAARKEYANVCRRLDSIASLDGELVAKCQGEIEEVGRAQLDPAQMEFSKPSPTEPARDRSHPYFPD